MSSFLPKLEDTLVDLLQFGDTGALEVTDDARRWTFYVQGGVLIGIERDPPLPPAEEGDPSVAAAQVMAEAMAARNALWDFREGAGPEDFGLFDVRRALTMALGRARELPDLLDRLRPVLEGWPELKVDPDTLTDDVEVQGWLTTLDGLGPGNVRLTQAPGNAGACLGAVWVAWKLGDLDLHAAALDDEGQDSLLPDEDTEEVGAEAPAEAPRTTPSDLGPPSDHDEGAEQDDDTHTHHTEPMASPRPREEGPSAAQAPARLDPFIRGVALARSGSVVEALPLLEAAFEDDPERPGLEEWLGYTMFAACRDTDAERARQGLSMLREVMYRTGPTGETPILPWILMARAQFERGDLLQARSILGSVLEREPDEPEAMHLDGRLKAAEAAAEALKDKPQTVSLARIARMTGLVAVLAGIVTAVQVVERYQPPRTDYAPQFAHVAPLRELHRVPHGWVGVTLAGSPAESGGPTALAVCQALAGATHMDTRETLTLISDRGVPLAECGARLE